MSQDAVQPYVKSAETVVDIDHHDSPKITDLIQQLDHDLTETQKSAPRRE